MPPLLFREGQGHVLKWSKHLIDSRAAVNKVNMAPHKMVEVMSHHPQEQTPLGRVLIGKGETKPNQQLYDHYLSAVPQSPCLRVGQSTPL